MTPRFLLLAVALCAAQAVWPATVSGTDVTSGVPATTASGIGHQRSELEFGISHEGLSNGFPDWRSIYLEGVHYFGKRHVVYGTLRETRRSGRTDSEVQGGLYYPLGETWTSVLEASYSPTHNVLPNFSLFGQLQKYLGYGWDMQAGYRHNEYTSFSTNVTSITAERYWSSFRGAYSLYLGRLNGKTAPSHVAQLDYYFGERNSIGAVIGFGREIADQLPSDVLITDVRSYVLRGRHWITPEWAISFEALHHEQGSLYTRQGVRLGLRHAF